MFFFSIFNLRHNVTDKFHHFHHLEFRFVLLRLNLSIESEKNKNIIFMLKSQGFNLNFSTFVGYSLFVKFLVEVHGLEGTGYFVSS